jgi:hypothetical protein
MHLSILLGLRSLGVDRGRRKKKEKENKRNFWGTLLINLLTLLIHNSKYVNTVTDVTRVLQMLEASRNASRFANTIEYEMFAQTSGIT